MPLLFVAIAAGLVWALWTGRITKAQLPAVLLAAAGGFIALRGQWVFGIGAAAVGIFWYRGMFDRLFAAKKPDAHAFAVDAARRILGASANDNADQIRARHRQLIAANHPDRGGESTAAQQLNEARDLLLYELERNAR